MKTINRRQFVQTTAAVGAAAAAIPKTLFGQSPTMLRPKSVKPVVVASNNGNRFKNGGTKTCVETAFSALPQPSAKPKDACITVLTRIAKNTIEKRLLTANGQPNFGLNFYCLNARGEYAGVSMYDSTYAVCTENGAQTLKTDSLFGQMK